MIMIRSLSSLSVVNRLCRRRQQQEQVFFLAHEAVASSSQKITTVGLRQQTAIVLSSFNQQINSDDDILEYQKSKLSLKTTCFSCGINNARWNVFLQQQQQKYFSTTSTANSSSDPDTTNVQQPGGYYNPYGRLWGRGYEIIYDPTNPDTSANPIRRILRIHGIGATPYLQNLVTADLTAEQPVPPKPEPRPDNTTPSVQHQDVPEIKFNPQLRAACFLDHKGRILTDALIWKISDEEYYIDVPSTAAESLQQHLKLFKLRKTKVTISDATESMPSAIIYGTLSSQGAPPGYYVGIDPRHPSLGMRILKMLVTENDDDTQQQKTLTFREMFQNNPMFPEMPGNYEFVRRLVGVAEGSEITSKIALEANQDNLNAISFSKGCYLGQELTARVFHTGIVRKRIIPLYIIDPLTEVPRTWLRAHLLQENRYQRKYTLSELSKLPSRLPRLSVMTAGTFVGIMTGVVPEQPPNTSEGGNESKLDPEIVRRVQEKAELLLNDIQASCVAGAKIIDKVSGTTIGQIVSAPIAGTNVVLALMRLESIGLFKGGVWSKTNRILIKQPPPAAGTDDHGDENENANENDDSSTPTTSYEFRYLPYVPLWWPELDMETGKGKRESDLPYSPFEVRENDDGTNEMQQQQSSNNRDEGLSRITIEQLPPIKDNNST